MINLTDALLSLRPNASWTWVGEDYADLQWFDTVQKKPTLAELNTELQRLIAEQPIKEIKQQRQNAYRNESDSLFFKAQRGEATIEEWKAKVEEIKLRFPYPTE